MYEYYKCVACGSIEAKEDKVSTPQGGKCLDCVNSEVGNENKYRNAVKDHR